MKDNADWCFAWVERDQAPSSRGRAAMLGANKWCSGDIITVSFLDGDPLIQAKVVEIAQRWVGPEMARLLFDFRRDTTRTLIRISFALAGSWSLIGSSCRSVVDPTRPTMNLAGVLGASEERFQSVVLHEFGHALGLVHEHQNPAGGILWNYSAVYHDLSGGISHWSKETIDANMFQPYATAETNFTQTDPTSIMMYPIPPRWTLNGFSVGFNSDLSPADRFLVRTMYA